MTQLSYFTAEFSWTGVIVLVIWIILTFLDQTRKSKKTERGGQSDSDLEPDPFDIAESSEPQHYQHIEIEPTVSEHISLSTELMAAPEGQDEEVAGEAVGLNSFAEMKAEFNSRSPRFRKRDQSVLTSTVIKDMPRAVILSEILGKPVSLRRRDRL